MPARKLAPPLSDSAQCEAARSALEAAARGPDPGAAATYHRNDSVTHPACWEDCVSAQIQQIFLFSIFLFHETI